MRTTPRPLTATIIALGLITAMAIAPKDAKSANWRGYWFVDEAPFSAYHDGTQDDFGAIQAAIDSAEVNGGGVVVFGPGKYRFDGTLTIEDHSVVLLGAGRPGWAELPSALSQPNDTSGTALLHYPTSGNSDAMHVGFQTFQVHGVAIRDMALYAAPKTSPADTTNNLLWMQDVAYCSVENVQLFHNWCGQANSASLRITSAEDTLYTTGNFFDKLTIMPPRNGSSGYGILLDVAGAAYNTGNYFSNIKIQNVADNKYQIRVQSTGTGDCNGHHFTNIRCDMGDGDLKGGISLSDSDNNVFANVFLDGGSSTNTFDLSDSCSNNLFFGQINGPISDDQPDPENKVLVIERTGNGVTGDTQNVVFPFIRLWDFDGARPSNNTNGTVFFTGANNNDSLAVYENGSFSDPAW